MNHKFLHILGRIAILMITLLNSESPVSSFSSCPSSSQVIVNQPQQPITIAEKGKHKFSHCRDTTPVYPNGIKLQAATGVFKGETTVSNANWITYTHTNVHTDECELKSYVYFKFLNQNENDNSCQYQVCTSSKACNEKGACNPNARCHSPKEMSSSKSAIMTIRDVSPYQCTAFDMCITNCYYACHANCNYKINGCYNTCVSRYPGGINTIGAHAACAYKCAKEAELCKEKNCGIAAEQNTPYKAPCFNRCRIQYPKYKNC